LDVIGLDVVGLDVVGSDVICLGDFSFNDVGFNVVGLDVVGFDVLLQGSPKLYLGAVITPYPTDLELSITFSPMLGSTADLNMW
jgi:hypothetical protein